MPRGLLMLLAALLLGGAATWITANWLDRAAQASVSAEPGADMPTARILVAARDLRPGDTLGPGMLVWQPWPVVGVRPEHLRAGKDDPSALAGAMVRVSVSAGAPLLAAQVVKRGDQGIMAALIAPGHRAVTIAVTAASGIAGFVGPGDRVDLILTAAIGNGGRVVGRTVVENVRVLGIDQRVDPVTAAALASGDGEPVSPPGTVTLEVKPAQAQEIAVAQELGKLSLSLRDLKAQQASSTPDMVPANTWDSDVTRLPPGAFAMAPALQAMATAGSQAAPLNAALNAQMPAPVPIPASGPAAGPAAGQSEGLSVERVNGVEVVRGSSNRGPAPAAAEPAA